VKLLKAMSFMHMVQLAISLAILGFWPLLEDLCLAILLYLTSFSLHQTHILLYVSYTGLSAFFGYYTLLASDMVSRALNTRDEDPKMSSADGFHSNMWWFQIKLFFYIFN
jgi:hypothetical protein